MNVTTEIHLFNGSVIRCFRVVNGQLIAETTGFGSSSAALDTLNAVAGPFVFNAFDREIRNFQNSIGNRC